MEHLLVCLVALAAAALTFFTGFGLGTLLMPVIAIFVPVEAAIAATAAVHLANNLFKLVLVGRDAVMDIVTRFGIPACIAAVLGGLALAQLGRTPTILTYHCMGDTREITATGLAIAIVIGGVALLELSPQFQRWEAPARLMPLGGALSGFLGGLSGHQGALRAAFLARAGLTPLQFVGTGAAVAVMVDVVRLVLYGATLNMRALDRHAVSLTIAASAAALIGTLVGARLVEKVTMRWLRLAVGVGLVLLAIAIGAGLT